MTAQAQHLQVVRGPVFYLASAWRPILAWGLKFGALGFCLGGLVTILMGWNYRAPDQWQAVNWGATFGLLTGAWIAIEAYRRRS
jgi:hypothetical protein